MLSLAVQIEGTAIKGEHLFRLPSIRKYQGHRTSELSKNKQCVVGKDQK